MKQVIASVSVFISCVFSQGFSEPDISSWRKKKQQFFIIDSASFQMQPKWLIFFSRIPYTYRHSYWDSYHSGHRKWCGLGTPAILHTPPRCWQPRHVWSSSLWGRSVFDRVSQLWRKDMVHTNSPLIWLWTSKWSQSYCASGWREWQCPCVYSRFVPGTITFKHV